MIIPGANLATAQNLAEFWPISPITSHEMKSGRIMRVTYADA